MDKEKKLEELIIPSYDEYCCQTDNKPFKNHLISGSTTASGQHSSCCYSTVSGSYSIACGSVKTSSGYHTNTG